MKSYYRAISSGWSDEENLVPIIFLHGMLQSGECYGRVAPDISRKTKRKVYLLDARNHGDSPRSDDMNYDALVEDILEFMDEHGIAKAILLGSSMGGRTALYFALKFPHKVEALIVEDMTPRNVSSKVTSVAQRGFKVFSELVKTIPSDVDAKEVRRILIDSIMAALGPKYVHKDSYKNGKDRNVLPVIKNGSHYKLKCNMTVLAKMLDANAMMQDLPDQGLVYAGDALFLYGTGAFFDLGKDPTVKKLFPKAVVKQVEGAFHLIHLDTPEPYVQIVSDFILNRSLPAAKY